MAKSSKKRKAAKEKQTSTDTASDASRTTEQESASQQAGVFRHGGASERARGRQAARPSQMPRKGWREILKRVKTNNAEDSLSVVSAGVAFYCFLAIFPAMAATVSIYGLVADPAQLSEHLDVLGRFLPDKAYQIIGEQLRAIVNSSGGALGLGLLFGFLVALWSATRGMKALIAALNIAYSETETRSYFKLLGLSLLLTLGAIIFGLLCLSAVAAPPAILNLIHPPAAVGPAVSIGRWPVLAILVMLALDVIYRYAPDRNRAKWKWINWGAAAATLLWIIGSLAFSFYVTYFGKYNETYGAIGAIVILLLWMFMSAYAVILGAELNAELEHQTAVDTTRGEDQPMGQRGAHVADTLGDP